MQKKQVSIPFYCVNSQVLWKEEAAVEHAVLIDQKIAELGIDAIFTACARDIAKINQATNRLLLGVVFEEHSIKELERLKKEGADLLILDQTGSSDQLKKVLKAAQALQYLTLLRTENPYDLSAALLDHLDILKWKFANKRAAETIFNDPSAEQKQLIRQLKKDYPQLSIIYGADAISANTVLNGLLAGMDGVGEVDCTESTHKTRREMLKLVHDYKNVQTFLNS
ncbi:hypothetical protein NRIC_31650 [Enterococcus florum]|uniref:Uncharacterized protein n=1 Tax=Enterococcus florum TaxID=2480627 RepID=A0A4P5PEY7_9ENTE|nr:hypothetical protein [Enterococcus florum]GCF95274.1 hypothetical protein NRIC_31650 [Enterococcus florum]